MWPLYDHHWIFLFLGNNDRALCISWCKQNRTLRPSCTLRTSSTTGMITTECSSLWWSIPTVIRRYQTGSCLGLLGTITVFKDHNRIYAPCMAVYLIISLPKSLYIHHTHTYIWFWPTLFHLKLMWGATVHHCFDVGSNPAPLFWCGEQPYTIVLMWGATLHHCFDVGSNPTPFVVYVGSNVCRLNT